MGIISKLIKFKIAKEIGEKAIDMFRHRRAVKRENRYTKSTRTYDENKLND